MTTEPTKGTLRLGKKGRIQVEFTSKKGKAVTGAPASGEVSQSLLEDIANHDGKDVEFDLVGGQPKKVRDVGGTFVPPRDAPAAAGRGGQRDRGRSRPHRRAGQAQAGGRQVETPAPVLPCFHNPYNFVAAPPRNTTDPDLGDHPSIDQDHFDAECYTGRIQVRMTARTPLLVPDTDNVREANGHKSYSLRCGVDGKPLIPASSIRGMLRSAYEAVTNSRFGKFSLEHNTPLRYRESTRPFRKNAYDRSARDLLDTSLRPATITGELSPADRVFGWVRSGGRGQGSQSVRGLLRVGPVGCTSPDAGVVEAFPGPGVPLAILAAPKPQQGRFYVAKTPNGEAQHDGLSKQEAGYLEGKGLRGRKVYPHQRGLPDGHWKHPTEDRTQTAVGKPAHYQEYRRPQRDGQEQRDDQNRFVLGWVKPGAEFQFDLHVHNLSKVELGALVWLLSLPDEHYLRFGGGKPLGFGSVRLTIDTWDVRTGQDLRTRYSGWTASAPAADSRQGLAHAFQGAIVRAYPGAGDGSFDTIPFIRAFLAACRGFEDNLPLHYPRATDDGQPGPPSPEGESFKWFVANERKGSRYALHDLVADKGLPVLKSSSGGQGRGSAQRRYR